MPTKVQAKSKAKSNGVVKQANKIVNQIEIPEIRREFVGIPIKGTSPLICHRFDQKAKMEILERQMGNKSRTKEVRDPNQEYLDSYYRTDDGSYGFPAVAFKKAMTDVIVKGGELDLTKVLIRTHIFVVATDPKSGLIPIHGEHRMREDIVVIQGKNPMPRYRAEFLAGWKMTLQIEYLPNVLDLTTVARLVNHAGFKVGVGERRPQKEGQDFGRFEVDTGREVETYQGRGS